MKKIVAWLVVSALVLGVATVAMADRSLRGNQSQRTPIRAYVGATVQQYDTLVANTGERIELQSFHVFADDSAMTPTLWITFMSKVSKTPYLRLQQAYTANQVLTTNWVGPWIFPNDSTILIYYNLLGAAPGTLDTLMTNSVYRIERY